MGGTDHICGVLPQGTTVGMVPGTGLTRSITQCGKAVGTFHVPPFLVSHSGGPGRKGTAAPLRLVQDAHASGEAHQAPPDGMMRLEYSEELADNGCGDSGKLHRGDL